MKPPYKFKERLDKANAFTNDVFLKWYPEAKLTDGRRGDLTIGGKLVELKIDFYPTYKNMFIETHSRYPDKIGGPWQAKEHQCELFAYCFAKRSEVWWFGVDTIIAFIEAAPPEKYRRVYVQNVGYSGSGILVPVCDLITAAFKIDDFKTV